MQIKCIPTTGETLDIQVYAKIREIIKGIRSREKLLNDIDNFLKNPLSRIGEQYRVHIMILRGEWGEGKTSTYYLHISPLAKEKKLYPIRASLESIINNILGIQIKKIKATLPSSNQLNYPVVTLYLSLCAADKITCQDNDDAFNKVMEFIEEIISHGYKGIVFFIDEFEELLKEDLKKRYIEINEKINVSVYELLGYYPLRQFPRDEGRKLIEEILHKLNEKYRAEEFGIYLIYATTPYAYIEFTSALHDVTAGKIERTLVLTDIEPLSRIEIVDVINKLIKYYTHREASDILVDPRLYATLHIISLGNFGSLNQVICKLLNAISEDDKIDYKKFVEILRGSRIFTYVGERECISSRELERLSEEFGEERLDLLYRLVSLIILSTKLFNDDVRISIIDDINRKFQQNYGYPIVETVNAFLINKNDLEKMKNLLVSYIKDHLYLQSGISEEKKELEELISQRIENLLFPVDIDHYVYVIPKKPETLNDLLGLGTYIEFEKHHLDELIDIIEKQNFMKSIDYSSIMLTSTALQALYPAPLPTIFASCSTPPVCREIWSKTRREIQEMPSSIYDKIFDALREIFKATRTVQGISLDVVDSGPYRRDDIHGKVYIGNVRQILMNTFKEPIRLAIYIVYSLSREAFRKMVEELKGILSREEYHSILVICVKCKKEYIDKLSRHSRIGIIAIDAPSLLELLSMYEAYRKKEIPHAIYQRYIYSFRARYRINDVFSKLSEDLEKEGLIINDLKNYDAIGGREYKRYIDLMIFSLKKKEPYSILYQTYYVDKETAWRIFSKLAWIKDYEKRTYGLLGLDIETKKKLMKILDDIEIFLVSNNLAKYEDNNLIIELGSNRLVKRILEILNKNNGKISKSQLGKYFIDNTSTLDKDIVLDIILYLMNRLGYIDISNNVIRYSLPHESVSEKSLRTNILSYKSDINDIVDDIVSLLKDCLGIDVENIFNNPTHIIPSIITCKKNGCKALSFKDLLNTIKDVENILRQNGLPLSTINSILKPAYEVVEDYAKRIIDYLSELRDSINNICSIYDDYLNIENDLKKLFTKITGIKEHRFDIHERIEVFDELIRSISSDLNKAKEVFEIYSRPKSIESIAPKKIQKAYSDPFCINERRHTDVLLYCYMYQSLEEYDKKLREIKDDIEDLLSKTKDILNIITEYNVDQSFIRNNSFVKKLKELVTTSDSIKVKDLAFVIYQLETSIKEHVEKRKEYEDKINTIKKLMIVYKNREEDAFNKIDKIEKYIKGWLSTLQDIHTKFNTMSGDSISKEVNKTIEELDSILQSINSLVKNLNQYEIKFNNIKKYFESEVDYEKLDHLKDTLDKLINYLNDVINELNRIDEKTHTIIDNFVNIIVRNVENTISKVRALSRAIRIKSEDYNEIIEAMNYTITMLQTSYEQQKELIKLIELYIRVSELIPRSREYVKKLICQVISDTTKCDKLTNLMIDKLISGSDRITYTEVNRAAGLDVSKYLELIKILYENNILRDLAGMLT